MSGTAIYKMTGSGNDFVMLDGRGTTPAEWPVDRVVRVCDRRTGVGGDGLVILTPERPGAVRMTYWNSDGSRAAMCGNAALCSMRLAVLLELAAPGRLCLLTDAGPVEGNGDADGDQAEIHLADFALDAAVPPGVQPVDGEHWMEFATVGVPHLVVRVDDVERVDVVGRGGRLRSDPSLGSGGANVNFVSPPLSPSTDWHIRTFERGVEGETLACGTGTVAAGVALAAREEAELPVRFRSRGNQPLGVRARLDRRSATDIWLGGQGRLVFRGVWESE